MIEDALQVVNGCTAVRGGEVGQSAIGKGPARSVERLVMDVHGIDVVEGFPAQAASIQITDAVAFSKKPRRYKTTEFPGELQEGSQYCSFYPVSSLGVEGNTGCFQAI